MLLTYINTHLDEKQTLDSLYKMFRINKNQIESLFREFLNITFYDYLKNRRYEEATYYLRFTELDGEQIASRIGLSSSQNLCKFFKQMSGTTPNNFRKEMIAFHDCGRLGLSCRCVLRGCGFRRRSWF